MRENFAPTPPELKVGMRCRWTIHNSPESVASWSGSTFTILTIRAAHDEYEIGGYGQRFIARAHELSPLPSVPETDQK